MKQEAEDVDPGRGPGSRKHRRVHLYLITILLSVTSVTLGVISVVETVRAWRRLHVYVPFVARYIEPILSAFRSVTLMLGLLVAFLFVTLGCSLWLLRRTVRYADQLDRERNLNERHYVDLTRRLEELRRDVRAIAAARAGHGDR